jgi:peptide/nickel transport system permease protein
VLRYLAQRFAILIGVVFVISVFCFMLVHLVPGNPAVAILGFSATPKNVAAVDKFLGLDKGLVAQYWTWMSNLLHGNLGWSPITGYIGPAIGQNFRVDLELFVYSQVLAYVVAVPLSVLAARRPNGPLDQATTTVTFGFYSLPAFILVIWLIQALTVHQHIFPGPGAQPFPSGVPWFEELRANLYVLFLPALILALGSIALFYRLLRSEMIQTLQEDFITMARSKGLSNRRILWHHALRPSMSTLLASTGNNVALLLTGLFIIDLKFNLPGIGTMLNTAIQAHDYIVIQSLTLVVSIAVVLVNLLVDLTTTALDPRIARG